jgi:hypothetical protein
MRAVLILELLVFLELLELLLLFAFFVLFRGCSSLVRTVTLVVSFDIQTAAT